MDSRQGVGKFVGTAHDFDPGPGVQLSNPLSNESAGVPVTLFWADALGASRNDYDLYAFDAAGERPWLLAGSCRTATTIRTSASTRPRRSLRLAVVKYAGDARYFQVSALRGRFEDSSDGLNARVYARVSPAATPRP